MASPVPSWYTALAMRAPGKHFIIGIVVLALAGIGIASHTSVDKKHGRFPFSEELSKDLTLSLTEGDGNTYAFRDHISVDAPRTGDLYAIASSITVSNRLQGDIGSVSETLTVQNRGVTGDIRGIADQAILDGEVVGEVMFLGRLLLLEEGGIVRKNLTSYAERTKLRGIVHGDVRVSGDLSIYGTVDGHLDATDAEHIVIYSGATISGDITYTENPDTVLTIHDDATISGRVLGLPGSAEGGSQFGQRLYDLVKTLIFLSAGAFLMFGLFPRQWQAVARMPLKKGIVTTLIGFGTILAGGIISIMLFVTPGMPLIALALFLTTIVASLLGVLSTPLLLGILIQRTLRSTERVTAKTTLIGILTALVLCMVLKPICLLAFLILGNFSVGYGAQRCIALIRGGR